MGFIMAGSMSDCELTAEQRAELESMGVELVS
jgi:hypothetical protein